MVWNLYTTVVLTGGLEILVFWPTGVILTVVDSAVSKFLLPGRRVDP